MKYFTIILFLFVTASTFAQTGIGTTTPHASAQLEVSSTTKGFLPPRLTTGQRDAIANPADGLIIYNTTTNTLEYKTASAWVSLISNPNGVNSGEMQYWDGSAWVPVVAGSEWQVLTFKAGVPTWIGGSATVPNVTSATGKIWMDRNLGASQIATSSTDAASYGDLYQWGRRADGHERRVSTKITTLATSDNPGHGQFIINQSNSPYDWRNPQNDNLWQGVSGTNNPCPSGYRLPTRVEWNAEVNNCCINIAGGAFNSPLKLPMAGIRTLEQNFDLFAVDTRGYYWSSTVNNSNSWHVFIGSAGSNLNVMPRANGASVRCIKD